MNFIRKLLDKMPYFYLTEINQTRRFALANFTFHNKLKTKYFRCNQNYAEMFSSHFEQFNGRFDHGFLASMFAERNGNFFQNLENEHQYFQICRKEETRTSG